MNAWVEYKADPRVIPNDTLKNTGDRGIIAGGTNGSLSYNSIDYISISSTSNSFNFGEVNAGAAYYMVGCSNGSRGVNSCTYNTNINYLTISTTGNTQNFGSLLYLKNNGGSCSNSTRGLIIGTSTVSTAIEYVTIATLGNSALFGQLVHTQGNSGSEFPTSTSNETTSLISGNSCSVSKVTINTLSDSTFFGNLSVMCYYGRAAGTNDTKCVFALGGSNRINTIEYFTYSTTSNATKFSELIIGRASLTSCSHNHRVLFCGGVSHPSTPTNTIDYITLTQQSNATDFGDISSIAKWCQCGYSGK